MPEYPDGPTSCDADPGCSPGIGSPGSPGPVAVYSFWGLVALWLVGFGVYKRYWIRRQRALQGSLKQPVELADGRVQVVLADKQDQFAALPDEDRPAAGPVMLGYKTSLAGEIGLVLLVLLSLSWLAIFLVLLIDQYNLCQMTSIDNTCFYGDYFITGEYDTNSKYYCAVWLLAIPWYALMVEFGSRIRNWLRLPVQLDQAEYVQVTALVEAERMVVNPSKLLKLWMKLTSVCSKRLVHSETVPVVTVDHSGIKYIEFECKRLVLQQGSFTAAEVRIGPSAREMHECARKGLSNTEWGSRVSTLGPNSIPFQVSSWGVLLIEETFSYFYLYQFTMYIVWFWFSYLFVSIVLVSVVIVSALIKVYLVRSQQQTIASMTRYKTQVPVRRDGQWREVCSDDLVPGDTVRVLPSVLPCDMVLMQGSAVCDESGLTGESMPVGKSVLLANQQEYSPTAHKSSTLFGGTTVLQAGCNDGSDDGHPIALVTATGIRANKGQLISTILHPRPMTFKYDEELPLVMTMLLTYAFVCIILAIYFLSTNGANSIWTSKWAYGVFTVSQILSPLLPIALMVGQTMSSKRLKEQGVHCLDPKRIAISGKIRVFAFDKTGTLTKEGLDFLGVRECQAKQFAEPQLVGPEAAEQMQIGAELESGLATCHNLKPFGEGFVGNQVEEKMFDCLQKTFSYTMIEDSHGGRAVTKQAQHTSQAPRLDIVKTFEFEHARMTMTVVVRDSESGECAIYCKGSPEKIGELCGQSIPRDYDCIHKEHATAGCYVLAMATRKLGKVNEAELSAITRDQAEQGGELSLIGLVMFRNELKPDSAEALAQLKAGDVRTIMLTGDNAQCGCYIARAVGMVEPAKPVLFGDDPDRTGTVEWSVMSGGATNASVADIERYKSVLDQIAQLQPNTQTEIFDQIELAITQKALDALCQSGAIGQLLLHIRIFARLRPDGKVYVVEMLSKQGLVVGMCGDGGNDCGALRAAHAGVALSDAEASVVSPFTSSTKSIESVVVLLKEGRAAITTSFATYKFLITYGQLFSVLKLTCFYYGVIMCQMDYILIDGVAVLIISYVMTLSRPEDVLPDQRPTSSLLGPTTMFSVIGMQILNFSYLLGALGLMSSSDDYQKWPSSSVAEAGHFWLLGDNWETSVIFSVVYSQFITSGMIFSFGSHWRKAVCCNWMLTVFWAIMFGFTSFLLLADANDVFHMASSAFGPGTRFESPIWAAAGKTSKAMPSSLRWELWAMIVASMICTASWEKVVVLGPVRDYCKAKYSKPGVSLKL